MQNAEQADSNHEGREAIEGHEEDLNGLLRDLRFLRELRGACYRSGTS
jgi:hypothetical protein